MTDNPNTDESGIADLWSWMETELALATRAAANDPSANIVRQLGFKLFQKLLHVDVSLDDIAKNIAHYNDEAMRERAKTFGRAHGFHDDEQGHADLGDEVVLEHILAKPFPQARKEIERPRAGIVFTAHPTFANPKVIRDRLAALACDLEGNVAVDEFWQHRSQGDITLLVEHEEVLASIERAQNSIRQLIKKTILAARKAWPNEWRALRPAPLSLATWVGYDLDGRTDIHWAQTFAFRLNEKALQLSRYAASLNRIRAQEDAEGLETIEAQLHKSAALASKQAEAFNGNLSDPDVVVAAANMLTADHPDRLVSLDGIRAALTTSLEKAQNEDVQIDLAVLCAEMSNYGLGVARIHLRVNAAQVRSALQADLGIEGGRAFNDRTALSDAAMLASITVRKEINFASVFLERMTARRQFMLCTQIAKHVDADTPIRFLIAECEAPATVMGAVYLARHYGVDHLVDISPLFETPEAIERGGRFLERLLDEDAFIDYLKRRGRISIQTGFSDSGRFMGQLPAALAMERLQILLARTMEAKGLSGIEAVVFNTHGESSGRGGYPGSLSDRFDHVMTPWARARFDRAGVPLSAESSYQGGDGFLHFQTEALSNATVFGAYEWACRRDLQDENDQFYRDINYSWDVYRAVKAWQDDLYERPSYQSALGVFGPNLLMKTGSRKSRRQSGTSARDAARSLRAIPHNAILQQLGAPANVSGGVGAAAAREPERFITLTERSPRMAALVGMAQHMRQLTSLSVLRAYASLYDPSFWTIAARRMHECRQDIALVTVLDEIGAVLAENTTAMELNRLANHLSTDRHAFDCFGGGEDQADHGFPARLYFLHAVRFALIMYAHVIVARTPSFSGRHDFTRSELMDEALSLDLIGVAERIAGIFPTLEKTRAALAQLEEVGDPLTEADGYADVHAQIVTPLREIDGLIKEISAGIAHHYGAFG